MYLLSWRRCKSSHLLVRDLRVLRACQTPKWHGGRVALTLASVPFSLECHCPCLSSLLCCSSEHPRGTSSFAWGGVGERPASAIISSSLSLLPRIPLRGPGLGFCPPPSLILGYMSVSLSSAMVLEKTLQSPFDSKEIKSVNPRGISSKYLLEGLMLKRKLQHFGHLIRRTDSLEKTLMLGSIEGGRRRG